MSKSVTVALKDIRENPVALRAVDRESEAYAGLRDSIVKIGILSSISLREKTEMIDGAKVVFYELCDGLNRYSAAKDAGLTEIPAILVDLTDAEVREAQIMANAHKIETKPVEYTKGLMRILAGNPTMTVADLASRLAKSASWIAARLGLMKLSDDIGKLVDDGKINISNAVALSKLPQDEQVNFVDSAMTMGADEFIPTVQNRQKELRDATRAGRAAKPAEFVPVMRLQKLSILKSELETPAVGPGLIKLNKIKTPVEAFTLALRWALNVDPTSIEVQRAKAEAKVAAAEDAKKRRAADRTVKKVTEAQKDAADAKAALTA